MFLRDDNRVTKAGFPTKFVESISAGVPVITNKTSDLEYHLKNGENGFLLGNNIENDLKIAIENDTKIEKINQMLPKIFGQLTVWNKEKILDNKKIIYDTLNNIGNEWMMNLIVLQEGKSYIIASNLEVQNNLEKLLNGKFQDDVMELEDVWLRKEIIKKAIQG